MRKSTLPIALLAATLLAVLTGAPPASAATWTIVPSPSPHINLNDLLGVWAHSATDAWAVGVFGETQNEDEQGGLALHWDGTAWTHIVAPNPQFRNEKLNGVSGTASNDVWAVGALATNINQLPKVPWVLHWDGTQWTVVPAPTGPNPGGTGRGGLRAVTALASNNVWAVGKSPGVTALVEHYDGTQWTVAPTPTINAGLNGMSAVSTSDIWAVGDGVLNANGTKSGLIMHYNGSAWTQAVNQVQLPSTTVAWVLNAVSAVAANNVWAVGNYTDQLGSTHALVQHWNGTAWSQVAIPNVATNANLSGIAANSATDIYAVGASSPDNINESGLVLHWNGTAWAQQVVPHSPAPDDSLTAVSITPGGSPIWAVGRSFQTNGARTTLILRG